MDCRRNLHDRTGWTSIVSVHRRAELLFVIALLACSVTACDGKNTRTPPEASTPAAAEVPTSTAAATQAVSPAATSTTAVSSTPGASPTATNTSAAPTPTAGPALADSTPVGAGTASAPNVLVPDAAPPDHVAAGQWAESNTQGGCLKVRVSFEEDSLQIDCLPYKLLVFVDNVQRVAGSDLAHLAGRGYVHPEGLTPVLNPAETRVPFESRPHDAGRVAYTTPDGNVWTLGADGANPTQITGGLGQAKGAFYSSLAWSPDGKKLLLRRDTDGGSHDVQIYEPDKGLRTIYPPQGIVAPVNPGVAAWSADSQHILVTDYDQPGNACERQNNQYALRSVDIDTGATVELNRTDGKGFIAGVTASPDGRTIAMLIGSGCDSVSFGICLLSLQADAANAVQAGQVRCPRGVTGGQVAWSPDGKYLAFTNRLQGRGDESQLSVGLPLQILDPRSATAYPLAWPLRGDRNIIGVVWLPDSRTLRIVEEVPRELTDTSLPDRVIRRITVDGSRFPIMEMAGDRLLDARPLLMAGGVHGDYVLATGARGELWVVTIGAKDVRWQLTDTAAGAAAWMP